MVTQFMVLGNGKFFPLCVLETENELDENHPSSIPAPITRTLVHQVTSAKNVERVFSSLEPQNRIKEQLNKIRALEDGWLDGEGSAPNAEGLLWLEKNLMDHFSGTHVPIRLYPTEDGNVQMEYTVLNPIVRKEVSIEIDLADQKGYWHAFDSVAQSSMDRDIDLSSEAGWKWISLGHEQTIIAVIRNYTLETDPSKFYTRGHSYVTGF